MKGEVVGVGEGNGEVVGVGEGDGEVVGVGEGDGEVKEKLKVVHIILREIPKCGYHGHEYHVNIMFVIYSGHPNLIIYIDKCTSIPELKRKISEKIIVPVEEMRLLYAGKSLLDDSCLDTYHVPNGAYVHFLPRTRRI